MVLTGDIAMRRIQPEENSKGGERMIREEIRIKELIGECLEVKDMEARERDVILEEDLPDPEATLRGDRRLLRTALNNMIDASMRRNRPGGKVIVGHRRDTLRETIVVSDNGMGIPYEELRSLYELFGRGSMSDPDVIEGMDGRLINLTIVRDVADLHGGRVGVRSVPGEGAAFSMHLPRSAA
jgi:signal transduction histidine kinase